MVITMPIRDFVCQDCGKKQERYIVHIDAHVRCGCGGQLAMLERSNEGPGHTTHVRIK